MDHHIPEDHWCCCCRREFLETIGTVMGGATLLASGALAGEAECKATPRTKRPAVVRCAFTYPPTETLRKAGYWSWPGSGFDAEGRQRTYQAKLRQLEQKLGMQIPVHEKLLDSREDAAALIAQLKQSPPDGLLLIPLKKGHWEHVLRIIDETKLPTVVLATLGVLLSDHINQLHRRPGVYLISAQDDFVAAEYGLRMIRTRRWMSDARLVSVTGAQVTEAIVPHLGTQVRTIRHARFVELYQKMPATGPVQQLAEAYRKGARAIVEPKPEDILDAARACFALRKLVEEEHGDAIMMECLSGLRHPRQHCPPCMGFMTLRDEGIPAGCQADLSATLTLMLVQQLFDRPGFQQNAAMDTEKNLYFGSHCTSPSKMNGPHTPAEPYILRSHAEAGWGCVPRVLFPAGQELTMCQYRPLKTPQMLIYSGKAVECPEMPPTGGCRSNVTMTINEVSDVCDVKGMHQTIFYGNHAKQLRLFCQLFGIEAVS